MSEVYTTSCKGIVKQLLTLASDVENQKFIVKESGWYVLRKHVIKYANGHALCISRALPTGACKTSNYKPDVFSRFSLNSRSRKYSVK